MIWRANVTLAASIEDNDKFLLCRARTASQPTLLDPWLALNTL